MKKKHIQRLKMLKDKYSPTVTAEILNYGSYYLVFYKGEFIGYTGAFGSPDHDIFVFNVQTGNWYYNKSKTKHPEWVTMDPDNIEPEVRTLALLLSAG